MKKEEPLQRHLVFLISEDWYFVTHRLNLALKAKEKGFRVTVITRVREHGETIQKAGVDLIPFEFRRGSLNPFTEGWAVLKLAYLYWKLKPAIVHQVAMKFVVFGTIAARLAGVPMIVNALGGLGFAVSSSSFKARMVKKVLFPLLRYSLHVPRSTLILQNRDDERVLLENKLVEKENVRIIPGVGVDMADYSPEPPTEDSCLVIMPARILRDKGAIEYVEAARSLKAKGVKARFAFVGSPDPENPTTVTEDELQKWVQEGVIEYWGWQKSMAPSLLRAHIVCLPSYREGMPKALIEASAAARPIVTTNVPGCKDVVVDGETGYIVPARNAQALADALQKLIENPEQARAFGLKARKRAEEIFTSSRAIDMTLAIYDALLKNGPPELTA